ncbi:MAG: D-tyrosyl-tRNA(Tyr) deacylase [Clostridia bacterium]|nr:D-tyrosyl-tRNA(Tyr) deacylase [Clostridia bacterium]
MRAVIQRVKKAKVTVDNNIVGSINQGFVVLLGVTHEDTLEDIKYLAEKIINLRIFEDEQGKLNLSLVDIQGEILSVSQFTLYADCRKGRRPSFTNAAPPEMANNLYLEFNNYLRELGIKVATGVFQAHMDVELVNNGPVTIILDSKIKDF